LCVFDCLYVRIYFIILYYPMAGVEESALRDEAAAERLDELLLQILDLVGSIDSIREHYVDTRLKAGFWNLALARHRRGGPTNGTFLSALQHDGTARATLFDPLRPTPTSADSDCGGEPFSSAGTGSAHEDGGGGRVVAEDDLVRLSVSGLLRERRLASSGATDKNDGPASVQGADATARAGAKRDPLSAFGVLVPTCARDAQRDFRSGTIPSIFFFGKKLRLSMLM
jgi:hypothetical protein